MKISNKVFILIIACLLALGALCLAFGIMLGGNLTTVLQSAWVFIERHFGGIFVFSGFPG